MGLQNEEWKQEERRLAETLRLIDRELERASSAAGGRKEQLVGGKRDLWDDLVYDTDDWFEAAVQLTQQAQELAQHARSYREAKHREERLARARLSPYFGRFDFREEGGGDAEPIYIGIVSIADEATHETAVYDWRAQISAMYYDFGPGPASYRAPDGEVTGEMTLKRQFVIRGGKLLAAFDTGVTIGDEMLQRILGERSGDRMKSIVTTIQREQNRIIRETERRFVFVQGAAGSGKTSAALQRIAFLLYRHRNVWEPEHMVLFSPNDIFNDYVSNVLPELGEESIPQTTLYEYVRRRLIHAGAVEHPYDQLEALLTERDGAERTALRREGIRAKSSLPFAERIDAYAKTLAERGVIFRPLMRGDREIVSDSALADMFYGEFGKQRPPLRLESMKEKLLEIISEREKKGAASLYRKWLKEPKYMGTEQELKKMSLAKARKAYAPLRELVSSFSFVDVIGTYLDMLSAFAADDALPEGSRASWAAISEDTKRRLAAGGPIPYEDAVPMLYLLEALHGASRMNRIRHVVVDEAQDYSPIEWAYLKRLFPNAGWTVVGDANQAIHGASEARGHLASLPLFPEEETAVIKLGRSYRSTRQISAFAAALLPDGETAEPFERDGPLPELVAAGEDDDQAARLAAETIARFRGEELASVAVIAKTAQEAAAAHRSLERAGAEAVLLTKEAAAFPKGTVVLPSYLAKGLEFDAVLVWDAGDAAYGREEERKLLYTVCTRGLHRLVLLVRGKPSRLLRDVPRERYAAGETFSTSFTIST